MTEPGRVHSRKSGLTTLALHRLDRACVPIWDAFGATYLVGTAQTGGDYRDVDVRTILADEEFDRLFACPTDKDGAFEFHEGSPLSKGSALWSLICVSVGQMLEAATGLPIDYQIQRMTEANEKYDGPRNPVGRGMRTYAGGGDATRFLGRPA
jgi:hypothetical protein